MSQLLTIGNFKSARVGVFILGRCYKSRMVVVVVFLEGQFTSTAWGPFLHQGLTACPKTDKPLPHRPGYSEGQNKIRIIKDARALTQIPVRATGAP